MVKLQPGTKVVCYDTWFPRGGLTELDGMGISALIGCGLNNCVTEGVLSRVWGHKLHPLQ